MPPARAAPSRRSPKRSVPRVFRVVALPAPSDREKTQLFLQRYMEHFPAGGEIVIFDRSWYNRAGVEYVMGFCRPRASTSAFLSLCPQIEKYVVDAGIILIKLWLEVGMEEQERRFKARIEDPHAAVEAEPDGYRILPALVRLFARPRHDVQGDRIEARAVARYPLRRQAAGAAELHRAYPEDDSATRRSPARRSGCRSGPTRAATTTRRACAE